MRMTEGGQRPRDISRTNGRNATRDPRSKDLDETNAPMKFCIWVMCQVQSQIKGQNWVSQVTGRRDLKINSFGLKIFTNALEGQWKQLSEFVIIGSGQGQCQVNKGQYSISTYMHFFTQSCDTCFMGQFGHRTRCSRLFYHLISFDRNKCEIQLKVRPKRKR